MATVEKATGLLCGFREARGGVSSALETSTVFLLEGTACNWNGRFLLDI